MRPSKYLSLLLPIFNTNRTREILSVNPVEPAPRTDAENVNISVFAYNPTTLKEYQFTDISECLHFSESNQYIYWINIDGLRKQDVEMVSNRFGIHQLIVEDILSVDQRPKMDDIEGVLFCLLNMLYFNDIVNTVEQEQISIVLGKNFVISFQEDPARDVFNPLRDKLRMAGSKVRQRTADFLCYSMIDMIVDNYYMVMEKLGDRIENIEDEIIRNSNKSLRYFDGRIVYFSRRER